MTEIKKMSVAYEVYKMLNEGYTHEQICEHLKKCLDDGLFTMEDIIKNFVSYRAEALYSKNAMEEIENRATKIKLRAGEYTF